MDDLISRQAALDALGERPMVWAESDYELGARNQYDADVLALETVPPADADLSAYSDKLWRAAYERGKKEAEVKHMRTVFIESDRFFTTDKRRGVLEDMKHEAGDDVNIVLLESGMHVAELAKQWTLVSERPPEEKGRYLVYYTLDGASGIRTAMYYPGGWLEWDVDGIKGIPVVCAWMQLPEPYKGGVENGKA